MLLSCSQTQVNLPGEIFANAKKMEENRREREQINEKEKIMRRRVISKQKESKITLYKKNLIDNYVLSTFFFIIIEIDRKTGKNSTLSWWPINLMKLIYKITHIIWNEFHEVTT